MNSNYQQCHNLADLYYSSSRIGLLILTSLICICSLSCAPKHISPNTHSLNISDSSEEIEKKIYSPNFMTLRGHAKISYKNKEKLSRLNAFIALEKDEFLYIDAFHFFGTIVYQLKLQKHQVYAFYPRENTLYKGKSTKENFYRLFNIKLTLKNLYFLLSNPLLLLDNNTKKITPVNEEILLEDLTTKIYINKELQITRIILYEDQKESMTIFYKNYAQFSQKAFPKELEIIDHMNASTLTMKFTDITFEETLDKKRFDIAIPGDAIIRNLDE